MLGPGSELFLKLLIHPGRDRKGTRVGLAEELSREYCLQLPVSRTGPSVCPSFPPSFSCSPEGPFLGSISYSRPFPLLALSAQALAPSSQSPVSLLLLLLNVLGLGCVPLSASPSSSHPLMMLFLDPHLQKHTLAT